MSYSSTLFPALKVKRHSGFTLIEILMAVVVVGLVLTAITSALTNSVKNAAESRYRIRASTLGQEAVESLSREKSQLGWGEFVSIFPAGTTTYCAQTLPTAGSLRNWSTGAGAGACSPTTETIDEAGVSFIREVQVMVPAGAVTDITVNVTVKWNDGTRTPTVTLTRVYRKTAM